MPTILPISDLRNYTVVLDKVDVSKPVYLTRNGRGTYVISKIDDYDRETTVETLVREIKKGERTASDATVSITDIAQKLGVSL
jgi:PHD/YefM family antitoxin component YafN of YafNO toxin-antitoxin module